MLQENVPISFIFNVGYSTKHPLANHEASFITDVEVNSFFHGSQPCRIYVASAMMKILIFWII